MNKAQYDAYVAFAKEKLGIEFHDINLLITALTHRSYVNEHKDSTEHNERLEFLGDAVLELVSSDFLFHKYNQPEGIMTAWRAALVNTEANAAAGERLGYQSLVRLSRGEKNGSERAMHVILADCYEAIIGAIYLDQGYATAFVLMKSLRVNHGVMLNRSCRCYLNISTTLLRSIASSRRKVRITIRRLRLAYLLMTISRRLV